MASEIEFPIYGPQVSQSAQDLQAKVPAFIDYYNRTMARLFNWIYHRIALTA
jgi:hypothetical protein